jgi:hypothetical protein
MRLKNLQSAESDEAEHLHVAVSSKVGKMDETTSLLTVHTRLVLGVQLNYPVRLRSAGYYS